MSYRPDDYVIDRHRIISSYLLAGVAVIAFVFTSTDFSSYTLAAAANASGVQGVETDHPVAKGQTSWAEPSAGLDADFR